VPAEHQRCRLHGLCDNTIANGNAGPQIQAYQCEQDLADQWMQVEAAGAQR
jgi:hypothetical protein